jgi:hypothetical protein
MMDSLTPVEKVLDRLEDYAERGGELRARCPAHNGTSEDSLSIQEGDDGRALLTCHAGCEMEAIVDALGLGVIDLFSHNGEPSPAKKAKKAKKAKNDERVLTEDELPDGTYYEFEAPSGEVLYIQRHKGAYYKKVGEDLWAKGLEGVVKIPYNLHELVQGVSKDETVVLVEGCKDAETAKRELGAIATTSGGATSWRPEYKSYFVGADVVIVPDNDAEGRAYAELVAGNLVPVARTVRVVHLPGLAEKGDLTDWLEAGHDQEEFWDLVEAAAPYKGEEDWPDPTPVEVELPSVHPLDIAMVPEPLQGWVADTSRRMDNAPADFAAAAAVVVAGALLGRRMAVRPKRYDDWQTPPNLWGGLVGLPASMKTPTLTQVLKPVKKLTAEAREEYEKKEKEHKRERAVAEARRKTLKGELESTYKKMRAGGASQGDVDNVSDELTEIDEKEAPTPRRYSTNDTSVEKMGELLLENPNGLLLYRDELTGWLRSLDKAGQETARAFYLEAWNGDVPHEIDRIGRGSLYVKAVCISVLGGIQPGPLSSYVEGAFDDGEASDGLLQRLQVIVYPDRGEYETTDLAPDLDARNRAYDVFRGLADLDVKEFIGYEPDDDEVPAVGFSPEAQKVFDSWRQDFEGGVVAEKHPAALESHFMKYRSLFPSLALVFEAVDFVDGVEGSGSAISASNALRARVWCEYLKEHAIKIYSPMLDTPTRKAKALLDHIMRGDVRDGAKSRDILRRGWSRLTSAAEVGEALDVLEEAGWVRREALKPDSGGRPSEAIRLHPELRD